MKKLKVKKHLRKDIKEASKGIVEDKELISSLDKMGSMAAKKKKPVQFVKMKG